MLTPNHHERFNVLSLHILARRHQIRSFFRKLCQAKFTSSSYICKRISLKNKCFIMANKKSVYDLYILTADIDFLVPFAAVQNIEVACLLSRCLW